MSLPTPAAPARLDTVFHAFPYFPKGLAGLGLLVARLSGAVLAPACCLVLAPSAPWGAVALSAAAALAAGLFARAAALLLTFALAMLVPAIGGAARALLALNALQLLSIVLAGAGGYSVDARLFGQRVIRIRSSRTSV